MTSESRDTEYCILGAGIAGLSLADALRERGAEVVVIEKNEVASGASGTPGGLVNPATGRRATKSWRAEACYQAILENLEKVRSCSKESFFQKNGVLRPALTQKIAGKMLEQFNKTRWPEGWCQWLDEREVRDLHPGINCVDGGLWLPIGLTVNVGSYLQALAKYLLKNGVGIVLGCRPRLRSSESHWLAESDSFSIRTEHLIFATGYETVTSPFWSDLPLHPVKGQVACFEADSRLLSFGHSLSSLGYIARTNGSSEFVQGSTYEHTFDHTEPDASGAGYLRKRLRRTLPELAENARLKYQWAGVRVSTPNRKPIVGRNRSIRNLHIFTGLGSKGLLYGKYLANHYADHLVGNTPIEDVVSIDRFYQKASG